MSYTCPICNMIQIDEDKFFQYDRVKCFHSVFIGKYRVIMHYDRVVQVFSYDGHDLLLQLKSPERLDEKYIDMVLLLK
jgi:hypothetical protein